MSGYIEHLTHPPKIYAPSTDLGSEPVLPRPEVQAVVVIEPDPRGERGHRRKNGYCKSQPTTIKGGYPLKLLVPENAGRVTGCPWVYPMTYGGGLVAGDRIGISVTVRENCAVLFTSQESTKIYHCSGDITSKQVIDYTVRQGALLCVLQDPVVCYKDANYMQTQTIQMSCYGNIAILDWCLAGRVARGELWAFKRFLNVLDVYVDEQLVLRERLDLGHAAAVPLSAAMKGYQVVGTFLVLGEKLSDISDQLYTEFGLPKQFGSKYDHSCMVSATKLLYKVGENHISGIYLKFMAQSTSQAFQEIRKMAEPLYDIIGGDPFDRKY